MSGPKGYRYSVVSAEELRRREDQAREGRCRQHVLTLAGLAAQLQYYGEQCPSVARPSATTHDGLVAWEAALQQAVDQAKNQVTAASVAAVTRQLDEARGEVDTSQVTLGARRTAPRQAPDEADAWRGRVLAEVTKVTKVVGGLRDQEVRDRLTALAASVATTTSQPQARGDLQTLKDWTYQAQRAQQCQDLAADVVLAVAHLETPQADQVRERAAQAGTPDDVAAIREDVAALVEADQKAGDAQYVRDALEDVLEEMGFDVGEGFELADLGRAVAVVADDEHPGYGLRFQVSPDNGMIYTRVVAEDGTSAAADQQVEEETCAKVYAVAAGLQRHGVSAELTLERQPGQTAVERHETPRTARQAARRKKSRSRPARGRSVG